MLWMCSVLLVAIGSTLGQRYLPPTHNTVTRTVTNIITATQCLTRDTFVTRTLEVIGQQSVIITLCTKNMVTETVRQPIVTPVNDQLVIRTTTQILRPVTSIVTDVLTNGALRTVTDTAVGTLYHRSNAIFSITQTQTQTQTLTQTTLVLSTQVNNRIVTVTIPQTVVNTIFVNAPIVAPGRLYAPIAAAGPAGRIISGQVLGFSGEGSQAQGAFNQGQGGFLQGQAQGQGAFNQGAQGGILQGQGGLFGDQGGFRQGQAQGQGAFNQGGFLQGQTQGQGGLFGDGATKIMRLDPLAIIHLRSDEKTYLDMHTHQTVDYVKNKHEEWLKFNHFESTIMAALEKLNDLIDEDDPDTSVPNIVHAFQTAEGIRKAYPDMEWFHLTGLIHDLGKIMAFYGEPQFSTVGDTFVVGCEFAPSIVYVNSTFHQNPDLYNPKYNTKYGIYEPNCGLENVIISWSHDEYMYQMLKHNNATLPDEALYMIRYHSFFPWHDAGDYHHLCNSYDMQMIKWVKELVWFDLNTKQEKIPDIEKLIPYYQGLIDKFCPGLLKW